MIEPIQLTRIIEEIVSPEKYLSLSKAERSNIARSEIIPPRLGTKDFGKIMLHYRDPVYKKVK